MCRALLVWIARGSSDRRRCSCKVKDIGFIDSASTLTESFQWPYDKNAKRIHFDCLSGSKRYPGCIAFIFSKGILKRVEISVLYTMTIKTMVDKLGPPDYYDGFVVPGETIACAMTFGWIAKQIAADNHLKTECQRAASPISSDTPITTLYYSARDDSLLQVCPACMSFPGIN